ncbi:MAG: hypothetical protein ACI85I_002861 [Arenicella sp.]|jgi:hypothetical protein
MQQNIKVFFLFFQFSENKKNIAKQPSLSFNNNTSLPEADAKVRKNPRNIIQNKEKILNKSQQTDLQIFIQPLNQKNTKSPRLDAETLMTKFSNLQKKLFHTINVKLRKNRKGKSQTYQAHLILIVHSTSRFPDNREVASYCFVPMNPYSLTPK